MVGCAAVLRDVPLRSWRQGCPSTAECSASSTAALLAPRWTSVAAQCTELRFQSPAVWEAGPSCAAAAEPLHVPNALHKEGALESASTEDGIEMRVIGNEAELDQALNEAEEKEQSIVIEWMAAWCRKCIYLKPKLEKLALEYPSVQFYIVDVNAVPSALVKRAQVSKMPTIQLWRHKKWQDEVIGGHKAWQVMDEIRAMLSHPRNNK